MNNEPVAGQWDFDRQRADDASALEYATSFGTRKSSPTGFASPAQGNALGTIRPHALSPERGR